MLIGRNKEKLADRFVYYFEKTMGLKIFGIFIVFPHENVLNKNQFREIISEIWIVFPMVKVIIRFLAMEFRELNIF